MSYEKIIEVINKDNLFAIYMGIEITEIAEGYAKGQMKIKPEFTNLLGSLHGGCGFTLADSIAGAAAVSNGYKMTTLSANFNYLAPVINEPVIYAEAKVIKNGKTIAVVEVNITNQTGKAIAKGDFTFFRLNEKLQK